VRSHLVPVAVVATAGVVAWSAGTADEAPISGTVKAIDTAGRTLTLQSVAGGKTRDVTIVLKPESKIVRFVRPTDPGKAGFVEQALSLSDIKPKPRPEKKRDEHEHAEQRVLPMELQAGDLLADASS
jgi:hypothetical protein